MKKNLLLHTLIVSTALVTGCAVNQPSAQAPFAKVGMVKSSANSYLNQAAEASGDSRYHYQLLAVTSMLQNGDTNAAGQLLDRLGHVPLQGTQKTYFTILQAYYDVAMNEPALGANRLTALGSVSGFPTNIQILYYQVAYQAYSRSNQLAKSVIAQIKLTQFSLQETDSNQQLILLSHVWRNIQNLSLADIETYSNSNDVTVRAWFQLALIAKQDANHPSLLVSNIKNWQQANPNHPANQIIPTVTQLNAAQQVMQPQQIALLLPLQGPFADTGKAIRDGYMAAYAANPSANKASIKVYDTTKGDVATIYKQAIANGAQLVVGPLTKDNVSTIASTSINVPTIALNYTDRSPNNTQLIEFGFSPEQAASQAAEVAWHHGTSNILAMVPAGNWGQTVSQAFNSTFQAQGGTVLNTVTLAQRNPTSAVMQLLGLQDSIARAKEIEQLTGRRLNYTPSRRQDANGIFLAVPPVAAREIEPLFKFYFAGNLPVYSTSIIYSGMQDPMNNQDINGTYFTDLSWVLSNNPNVTNLRNVVQASSPDKFGSQNRFYALGADAYLLSQQFNRVLYLPSFAVNGVTGQLYLNGNQQIYCQLSVGQIQSGNAVLVR